jgi:hypothetical protein
METSVAAVTVNVVVPATLVAGSVAVIVVLPTVTEVARPFDPPALLIVATAGAEEAQVTDVVRFWVVLSLNVPVAVNCCVVPFAMLGVVGVTSIETKTAWVLEPPPEEPPPHAERRRPAARKIVLMYFRGCWFIGLLFILPSSIVR